MLYIISLIIAVIVGLIVYFVPQRQKREAKILEVIKKNEEVMVPERKMAGKVIKAVTAGLITLIFLWIISSGIYAIQYFIEKKNFKSFDLNELKRQELIIQTISFKKFFVSGTEVKQDKLGSDPRDEITVWFVSGEVDIFFKDIENLEIDAEKSSIGTKTLRLNYYRKGRKIPFDVDVRIKEEDIYKVTDMESKETNFFGLKIDFIKPETSQTEKVESAKKALQEEFEKQIFESTGQSTSNKVLQESDVYQTFLTRLTEIITSISDWEFVEIDFGKGMGGTK